MGIFTVRDWEAYRNDDLRTKVRREVVRRRVARGSLIDYTRLFHDDFLVGDFHALVARRLDAFVEACARGEAPRLILQAPPRHGKSVLASENLPPYAFGRLKALGIRTPQIIHTTYSQELADDFGRKVRARLLTPLNQDLFPDTVPSKDTASMSRIDLAPDARGGAGHYFAVGAGGAITGRGAHIAIIDDPIKGSEEADSERELRKQLDWFFTVLRTRLMPGAGILLIMTRWSEADLAGQLPRISDRNSKADRYEVLSFPAISQEGLPDGLNRPPNIPLHAARYSLEDLEAIRASISPRAWSALYQQCPVPESGGFFDAGLLEKSLTPLAEYPKTSELRVYIGGDLAIGRRQVNDYTVFWPLGVDHAGKVWFLPDIVRGKFSPAESIKRLLDLAERLDAFELVIEDGHLFRGMRDYLNDAMRRRGRFFRISAPWPTKDKGARAAPLRAHIESSRAVLPDTVLVRDVVFREFLGFLSDSAGVHDDTVDAAATGVSRVSHLLSSLGPVPYEPPAPGRPDPREGMTWDELQAATPKARGGRWSVSPVRRLTKKAPARRVWGSSVR